MQLTNHLANSASVVIAHICKQVHKVLKYSPQSGVVEHNTAKKNVFNSAMLL